MITLYLYQVVITVPHLLVPYAVFSPVSSIWMLPTLENDNNVFQMGFKGRNSYLLRLPECFLLY